MKATLISAAIAICVSLPARADTPVIDAAAVFDRAKSYLQDIKGYVMQTRQYLVEAQQLAQQVQTYAAFVQNPSLGAAMGLMGQAGLMNDLPVNPYQVMALTSGYGGGINGIMSKLQMLSTLTDDAFNRNHIHTCTNSTDWACQQQVASANAVARVQGMAGTAYQNLRDHLPVLQALRDRAATATTPAEREQVSLALQQEIAWNQNMNAQISAIDAEARSHDNARQQQSDEWYSGQGDKFQAFIDRQFGG